VCECHHGQLYLYNTNKSRERIRVEINPRARRTRAISMQEKIYENLRNPARAPRGRHALKKCQHRKWPLAHERPRVTQKFISDSGVIHQKLRLELIQHAGYLVLGLHCVFMPFWMGPDVCREPAHGARAARARGIS
jgi:hypothetical protein